MATLTQPGEIGTPQAQEPTFSYKPELDGLRAIAVLMVIEEHSGYLLGPGYLGVTLFFVLSGYLISGILLAERARFGKVDFKRFYIRRALRLYPALVVGVALAIVVTLIVQPPHSRVLGGSVTSLLYVMDFWAAADHAGAYFGHTWSLSVEEQFYILWPITLLALGTAAQLRRRLPLLAASFMIVTALAALALGPRWAYLSPLGATPALLAGATLAVVRVKVPRGTWIACLAVYGLIWSIGDNALKDAELYYGQIQAATIAAAALIAWTLRYRPAILRLPILVWTGKRSYGLYLFHIPMFWGLRDYGTGIPRSANTAIALALTFALAAASYRWVELPFLRRKPRPSAERPTTA